MTESTDVLIAGGGPVGLTLAMDLGWRGIRCTVIEPRTGAPGNPRCNTTSARSMENYRRLGISDRIRQAGLPGDHPTDVVYTTSFTGHELTRFELPSSGEVMMRTNTISKDWPTPEPPHRICQLFLEPLLASHAEEYPSVTMNRGWSLELFQTTATDVRALVREESTGRTREVTASYLVGCDGGHSIVRRSIGSTLHGDDQVGDRRVSVFLRSSHLAQLDRHGPAWMYWFYGPEHWGTIIALNGRDLFLCHLRVPVGMEPDDLNVTEGLRAAVGQDFQYEILQIVRWTARRLVADKLRSGSVLLAGDAAHLWIPTGGFGMNAGIADATALSWRLQALLQGWGGGRLLDDYAWERRLVCEQTSLAAAKLDGDMYGLARDARLHSDDASASELRADVARLIQRIDRKQWYSLGVQMGYSYLGSSGIASEATIDESDRVDGGQWQIDRYDERPQLGVRLPHCWLNDGSSLFDALGSDFTLLCVAQPASATKEFARAAVRAGMPLKLLEISDQSAVGIFGRRLVLVRPDQHVAWLGRRMPAEPDTLLRELLGTVG